MTDLIIENNKERITNMSDKERIEYCFIKPENINELALIVEEIFNSKQTIFPEELINLSISEINSVFIQALINITDKDHTRLKNKSDEFNEFNKLTQILKIQSKQNIK